MMVAVGSQRKIHRRGFRPPPPPPRPPRYIPTSCVEALEYYARLEAELKLKAAVNEPAWRMVRVFRRVPARPTVGEETARLPVPVLFLVCAMIPCLFFGISGLLACSMYTDLPELVASDPWRPPAIVLGGVVPALVTAVMGYMHLHLPRAPWALREALVNVGLYCLGGPLWIAGILVAGFGSIWIFVAMACLVAILVAALIAFWVCLVCVYG